MQETRLYDPDRGETRSMRSKEDAQDYRYFPDPDLPPLVIDRGWVERVRAAMPELPEARRLRFSATSREHFIELMKGGNGVDLSELSDQVFEESNPLVQASAQKPTYALSMAQASALTISRELADFFEETVAAGASPKTVARWMLGELLATRNRDPNEIAVSTFAGQSFAALLRLVENGKLQ